MELMKFNLKEKIKQLSSTKKLRMGGYSAVSAVLVAAIGIALIVAVDSLPTKYTRLDLSGKNLYNISTETENIVKGLDKTVDIYYIAQSATKDEIIDQMLQRYASISGNINYSIQDPAKNPNFASQYTDETVEENSVIVVCGEKSRYVAYSDIYKTEVDYSTYTQTSEFDGENCITSAISYVASDDNDKIYCTTGHGELELETYFSDMLADRNAEVESLTLVNSEGVPDDADCIIINEPQSDLSEQDVTMLEEYRSSGGNIIVISGYTGQDFANLNSFLSGYGCELERDLVVEGSPANCVQGFNYYLVPNIASHEITDPLNEENYFVLTPMSINIKSVDGSSASMTEILTTSSEAYVKTDTASAQTLEKTDADPEGTYTTGVVSELTADGKTSKLLLVSSSGFLSQQADMIVSGGNGDLFLNAVSWMTGREEGIAIHAKSLANEMLSVSDSTSGILSFITIFLIPAIVIAAGIYILIKRRRR